DSTNRTSLRSDSLRAMWWQLIRDAVVHDALARMSTPTPCNSSVNAEVFMPTPVIRPIFFTSDVGKNPPVGIQIVLGNVAPSKRLYCHASPGLAQLRHQVGRRQTLIPSLSQ